MRNVWAELTRRDRNTGEFFHPIRRSGSLVNRTQEQAHDQELGHLLHFVFCTACDPPIVSKSGEIEAKREEMLQEAQIVHKIAADLLATNASDSALSTMPLQCSAAPIGGKLEHALCARRPIL
jgi:hypothetical protein